MLRDGWRFNSVLSTRDQLLVERDGLVRNAGPGKVPLYALAASVAHAFAGDGVLKQRGEPCSQVACELIRMDGEACGGILLEGDEVAGFTIDDDFEDAPGSTCHHGCPAGHGFEVDDAEGLVDGRATEDPGMGVE